MHKYEQSFITELKKWLAHNKFPSCDIEAKIAIGTSPFNFKSGFKPHQIPCLLAIRSGAFGYKISDMDRMQKPFDLIHRYKAESFVVITWIRKGNKKFYIIHPESIQVLIDAGRVSMTEEEAFQIAEVVGILK